jgi:hypothetical protein
MPLKRALCVALHDHCLTARIRQHGLQLSPAACSEFQQ